MIEEVMMQSLKSEFNELSDIVKEMQLMLSELIAFEYAVTGIVPKNKIGDDIFSHKALYFIHHYNYLGAEKLLKKINPINPRVDIETIERMVKGFLRGQKYTQIEYLQ